MHKLSSYFILLLALANFCAGSPIGKREGRFWGYDIDVSDYSDDYGSKKDYLRIITPNDGTTWDADSYQSVTWSYDGSSNLGYGEKVEVILLARESNGGWKKVDTLPSATTGSGISNYHVRKDLGKASEYQIVLVIAKAHYSIKSQPFKIKALSGHNNEGGHSWSHDHDYDSDYDNYYDHDHDKKSGKNGNHDYNHYSPSSDYDSDYNSDYDHSYSGHSHDNDDSWSSSYDDDKKHYLQVITPTLSTVWDADSYQSVTWKYDGSSNLGYGETVTVSLYARKSSEDWKLVDTLPSGTTGGGISNYHVRPDLGEADYYLVVLEISSVDYTVASKPFEIKKQSGHNNYGGDTDSYGDDKKDYSPYNKNDYLRIITPNSATVWQTGSYQSATWTATGTSNVNYGAEVDVYLYAYDSNTKSVKKVDTLPSATLGSGISNYHVRDDLGKADYYIIVLEISSKNYRIHGQPFKIKKSQW